RRLEGRPAGGIPDPQVLPQSRDGDGLRVPHHAADGSVAVRDLVRDRLHDRDNRELQDLLSPARAARQVPGQADPPPRDPLVAPAFRAAIRVDLDRGGCGLGLGDNRPDLTGGGSAAGTQRIEGARRADLDRKVEGPLLVSPERTDADEVTGHFLALLVGDGDQHRVLPGVGAVGVPNLPLHHQGRGGGLGALDGCELGIEAQVMPARRAHARALENRGPAVRTGPRGSRCSWPDRGHAAVLLRSDDLAPRSSQPNSAWPRIREPAATVSDPALRSPLSTPVSSSSTRDAASMLPSSSPAMVTVLARTPPVTLAPTSMVRLPWTWMSPLKRPAILTWPAPSILPSMVRSAAISDSLPLAPVVRRIGSSGVAIGRGASLVATGSGAVATSF